jgi:hypothetical protein
MVDINWKQAGEVLDALEKAFTILAISFGGVWAYFNFFKGRTYRPRLEVKASGRLVTRGGTDYLVSTAHLKNVGLSKVEIKQEGTGLLVSNYDVETTVPEIISVQDDLLTVFPVFEKHGWVEPGELIEDQRLIALPAGKHVALRLGLRITASGIEWNSWTIIEQLAAASSAQSLQSEGENVQMKPEDEVILNRRDEGSDREYKQLREDRAETRRIEQEKLTQQERQSQREAPKTGK